MDFTLDRFERKIEFFEAYDLKTLERKVNARSTTTRRCCWTCMPSATTPHTIRMRARCCTAPSYTSKRNNRASGPMPKGTVPRTGVSAVRDMVPSVSLMLPA